MTPITIDDTYTCDWAGCAGDGVNTPAQASSTTEHIPPGWIQVTGTYTVGTTTLQSTKFFHSLTCVAGQFTGVTEPTMASLGATP